MYPKYKCLGCGWTRRRGKIIVVCPICGGKTIRMEDGVDIEKIMKIVKGRGRHWESRKSASPK